MENAVDVKNDPTVEALFKVGAHYGYKRSRRHPSVKDYLFGIKSNTDIFDLSKTKVLLEQAKEFVQTLGKEGKQLFLVSGKHEAIDTIRKAAERLGMPYVAGRWVGGTLTNFGVIRARVDKMLELRVQREKGELSKYTKKERLLIDREIERLEHLFSGLTELMTAPAALFVIDPGKEHGAVEEARKRSIPVVALASSDCNVSLVSYPIVGNDASSASIAYFVAEIASAYEEGKRTHSV